MEESKGNHLLNKRFTVKIGGGGIGAVVLLGGALCAAATLASAFVVGKKGRSSGKYRHRSPPPHERNIQKEKDEADKPEPFVVLLDRPSHVDKNPSSEAIKEAEPDNYTASNQSSPLDEKSIPEEINVENPEKICDIETCDEILSSISEPIEDGENKGTSKQEPTRGEVNEVCSDDEEIKVILVDKAADEVHIDENEVGKNVKLDADTENGESEEGQNRLPHRLLDGGVIEHENVNGEGKEGHLDNEKENESIDQMKDGEMPLVKLRDICDQRDDIIVEKCEDLIEVTNEETFPCDVKEENACDRENMRCGLGMFKEDAISAWNIEITKDERNDLAREIEKEVEVGLIFTETIEIEIGKEVEEEVIFLEDENEDSSETIASAKNDLIMKNNGDEVKDENPTEYSCDGKFSSDEVKLIDREVGGKIQEDKAVQKGEHVFEPNHAEQKCKTFTRVDDSSRFSDEKLNYLEKTFIEKHVAELAMLIDQYLTNWTSRRVIIATLSVMSSLSYSWFFGLSYVKLCVIVFLTMVLSSMVIE